MDIKKVEKQVTRNLKVQQKRKIKEMFLALFKLKIASHYNIVHLTIL